MNCTSFFLTAVRFEVLNDVFENQTAKTTLKTKRCLNNRNPMSEKQPGAVLSSTLSGLPDHSDYLV